MNTVIQGTAADVIKLAMIHTRRRFQDHLAAANTGAGGDDDRQQRGLKVEDRCRLLLQIHDELLFECLDTPDTVAR